MSVYEDIAAILHPMPLSSASVPEDIYSDFCLEVEAARKDVVFNLEAAWDADEENEPLLSAIASARVRKEQAEADIRRLVAYGREFTRPRPYKLVDLAGAAGMSVSGVRTAYDHQAVADVAESTGRKPREWRAPDRDDPPEDGEA